MIFLNIRTSINVDNDNGNINCNFKKQGDDDNVKAAEKGEKRGFWNSIKKILQL